jgi:hypothetical protein
MPKVIPAQLYSSASWITQGIDVDSAQVQTRESKRRPIYSHYAFHVHVAQRRTYAHMRQMLLIQLFPPLFSHMLRCYFLITLSSLILLVQMSCSHALGGRYIYMQSIVLTTSYCL